MEGRPYLRVMKLLPHVLFALTLSLSLPAQAQEAKPAEDKKEKTEKAALPPVKNITPDEAQKLITEKKDVIVLDVRTPEEFKSGHIAGAKNLDFMAPDFKQKLAELDKSKEYCVHCQAGGRSSKAVKEMQKQGFTNVEHMNGGMNAWAGAGKPMEK